MRRFRKTMLAGLLLLVPGVMPALAEDGWQALLKPGTHALMRHAQAPGTGDPENFSLRDCTTQRNLDDGGRAQAQATGAEIRSKTVRFTRILSSQWCRALETARRLDLGPVEEEPLLNSFFEDSSGKARQTGGIIARLGSASPGEKLLLVTHQVNITALTGIVPRSGELTVISIDTNGAVQVEGRIDAQPAVRP